MKTLLLILSFCITSISFSQDYNTQIDEKELENTVYQNRINNRAKYQGVISNFEIAIDVENSILTKEELAKKINSLDGVLLVSMLKHQALKAWEIWNSENE